MLPKSRRISRSEVKTFGRNMAYHGHFLSLFIYKKSVQTPSQFSFSVSKKVAKNAVLRNKLRRRGYATIASVLGSIKPGYYCMLIYKKGASTLNTADISTEIRDLLHKANLTD